MYNNVRVTLTILFCSSFVYAVTQQRRKPVMLCPNLIAIIDGKSFGFHGELVGSLYKLARDIQSMQLGKLTGDGRVGGYIFQGQPHCIKSLALLEKMTENYLKDCTIKDRASYEKTAAELAVQLKKMKQDFKPMVSPLIGMACGAEDIYALLLRESVPAGSPLLNGSDKFDTDMTDFDKCIISFRLFDQFCTDLVNFLGDLVYSCPKARAQFEELKENYVRKQAAGK